MTAGLPATVIVVAGASGSGKSVLCRRLARDHVLPMVHLDDFYKDGGDPSLPRLRLRGASIVDWDHPESWTAEDAVSALVELCRSGVVDVPVYDIARDGRVGHQKVRLDGSAYVLAEGIFADQIVVRLREAGVLADAVCIRNAPWVTFWRRLSRDLRESRKPPWVLVRRGLALVRTEPALVARAEREGCAVVTLDEAERRILALIDAPAT